MSQSDYLLGYGRAGNFARFVSPAALSCRRGDKMIVRTDRGHELGFVLWPATDRHAQLLTDSFVGEILRPATREDQDHARRMARRSDFLFADARELTDRLNLPLEILDAEVLFDDEQAVLHYLRASECDPQPLLARLGERHRLRVSLHSLASAVSEREGSACGGGCAGSGCGSCASGNCTTCRNGPIRSTAAARGEAPWSPDVHPERIALLSTSDV